LACDDPALEPFAASLSAWDEGRAALADGRPADAVTAFAAARVKDPGSVALRLWEAKALADAGRLDEADARLSELIHAESKVGEAWYNRAAYRARAGRLAESAADLQQALALGTRSALEAADDPDFSAAREAPAFAGILPAQPLQASAHGPDGAVFVGSRYTLAIAVTALPKAELVIERLGGDPGCLRLQRIVQDDHAEAGQAQRQLSIDFRAEGPCDTTIGPLSVAAGTARISLDAIPVQVEAPPGAAAVLGLPPLPGSFPVPSAFAAPGGGFLARRIPEGVVAMGPLEHVIAGGGRPPDVVLEWRVDGQARANGGWWRISEPIVVSAGEWSETVP